MIFFLSKHYSHFKSRAKAPKTHPHRYCRPFQVTRAFRRRVSSIGAAEGRSEFVFHYLFLMSCVSNLFLVVSLLLFATTAEEILDCSKSKNSVLQSAVNKLAFHAPQSCCNNPKSNSGISSAALFLDPRSRIGPAFRIRIPKTVQRSALCRSRREVSNLWRTFSSNRHVPFFSISF